MGSLTVSPESVCLIQSQNNAVSSLSLYSWSVSHSSVPLSPSALQKDVFYSVWITCPSWRGPSWWEFISSSEALILSTRVKLVLGHCLPGCIEPGQRYSTLLIHTSKVLWRERDASVAVDCYNHRRNGPVRVIEGETIRASTTHAAQSRNNYWFSVVLCSVSIVLILQSVSVCMNELTLVKL